MERVPLRATNTFGRRAQARVELTCDDGADKAGAAPFHADGKETGKGRVERVLPLGFSASEAFDAGWYGDLPVPPDNASRGDDFTGEVA